MPCSVLFLPWLQLCLCAVPQTLILNEKNVYIRKSDKENLTYLTYTEVCARVTLRAQHHFVHLNGIKCDNFLHNQLLLSLLHDSWALQSDYSRRLFCKAQCYNHSHCRIQSSVFVLIVSHYANRSSTSSR